MIYSYKLAEFLLLTSVLEHGITYAGPTEDAYTLDAAINGVIVDAQVQGSQMMLRSQLGIAAASRASGGDPKAFENATKFLVRNMLRSLAKRLEVGMFYGGVGIGEVAAATDAPNTITIATSEWAPGIFAGSEQMKIQIYDATGVTLRLSAQITEVNMETRTLTLVEAPVAAGVVATDVIFYQGAKDKEAAGIHKILTNSGSLFNINASTYSLWKGNTLDLGGSAPLSFASVQDAIAKAVEKGLDSAVTTYVNPRSWSDLLTEQTALRQFDSSYSVNVSENGSQELTFYGQNGKVEIVPSIHVKEGNAYVLCMEELMRIGSTDITFHRPDQEGNFFREVENAAAYELRAYSDQALFCSAPGKSTLITGIDNEA